MLMKFTMIYRSRECCKLDLFLKNRPRYRRDRAFRRFCKNEEPERVGGGSDFSWYLLTFEVHFSGMLTIILSVLSYIIQFLCHFSSVFSNSLFEPSSFPDFSIFSDPSRWWRDLIPIYSVNFGFSAFLITSIGVSNNSNNNMRFYRSAPIYSHCFG